MNRIQELEEALALIRKYQPSAVFSIHDGAIYVGIYNPFNMADEDVQRLRALGWCEREDSWAREFS